MATCTVSWAKKGMKPAAKAAAAAAPVGFSLQEGTGDTVTVNVVDGGGNVIDPASLSVTLAVTSDTPATLAVAAPVGLTYKESAPGPVGTANVTVVATFATGGFGPFSFSYPVTVAAGGPAGITITHGAPVANP
jgi:hypothetical protein